MPPDGSFRIAVQQGPNAGRVFILTKDVVTMGRDVSNDIVFADPESSRHHCRLTWQGAGYAMEDLGSTNGTFINGMRLTQQRMLMHGDLIALGETIQMTFESVSSGPGENVATMVDEGFAPAPPAPAYQQQSAPPPPPQPQYQQQASPPPQQASPQQYQQAPPVQSAPPQAGGGRQRTIAIALGCGTAVVCCAAISAGLAFAPCDFWLPLFQLVDPSYTCSVPQAGDWLHMLSMLVG